MCVAVCYTLNSKTESGNKRIRGRRGAVLSRKILPCITTMMELKKTKTFYREERKEIKLKLPDAGLVFIVGERLGEERMLLDCIAAVDTQQGDTLTLGNRAVDESNADAYRAECVATVLGDDCFSDKITVRKLLSDAGKFFSVSVDDVIEKRLLELVGLSDQSAHKRLGELSPLDRRRAAVAAALVKQPQIIIAERPALSLSGKDADALYELLRVLSKDMLVAAVAEDAAVAQRQGDIVVKMKNGGVESVTQCDRAENAVDRPLVNSQLWSESGGKKRIKAKLPFAKAVKMGAGNLKRCLAFSVAALLSGMIALSCFFTATIFLNDSSEKRLLSALTNANTEYVTLMHSTDSSQMTALDSKLSEIRQSYPELTFLPVADYISFFDNVPYAELQEETEGAAFLCGGFPQDYREVVIHKELADKIMRSERAAGKDITEYSQLLNGGYEYDDGVSIAGYQQSKKRISGVMTGLPSNFAYATGFRLWHHYGGAVKAYKATVLLSGNEKSDLRFLRDTMQKYGFSRQDELSYKISTPFDGEFYLDVYNYNHAALWLLGMSAAMSAITVLLVCKLLTASRGRNSRGERLIRTAGCGNRSLIKLYVCQAALLMIITLILSSLAGVAVLLCCNQMLALMEGNFGLLFVSAWNVLALMALGVLIAFAAILPHIIRMSKRTVQKGVATDKAR